MIENPANPNQVPKGDMGHGAGKPKGGRSEKDLGLVDSKTITDGDHNNPKPTDIVGHPVCPEKGLPERRRGDSFRWK